MDKEIEGAIPNTQFRQTLLAINKVLGEKKAKEIYHAANLEAQLVSLPQDDLERIFPAADYARLLRIIDTTYGHRGQRILERIGRESFHIVLREQPALMNTVKRIIGLWNQGQRRKFMLETLVEAQHKTNPGQDIWLEEKDNHLAYIDQDCLNCYHLRSTTPLCSLTAGFIAESVHWAGGSEIRVEETHCIAMGDPYCRFQIGD
jgi:predicted hydrocarbon binding protein